MLLKTIQNTSVPATGFGTWQIRSDECVEDVGDGIRIGYRHIDSARMYVNEKAVSEGIRKSGVAHEELYITSKVPQDDLSTPVVRTECEASLRDLGIDYLDLYLIHWPSPEFPLAETPGALGRLRDDSGLIRHLAHGELFGAPHGKTPSQVALRWLVEQPKVTAVPRSTSHDHRVANFSVFDFELTPEDRERIDALPKDRRQIDPDHAPDWD